MDLSPQFLRHSLHCVDLDGWNSDAGRRLLDHVRRAVVIPVVRRSGLRGPAADQAEASGWEAAWDALRRPTARTAENPGGMIWVAVRRAVAAEVDSARILGGGSVDAMTQEPAQVASAAPELGPVVAVVLEGLVGAGWDRADAADAIEIMAEHAAGGRTGSPTTRWRWVSLRLGVPEWQARRLAALLLGGGGSPGVLELVATHGSSVLEDPSLKAALRATTVRWAAGPGQWLAGLEVLAADRVVA